MRLARAGPVGVGSGTGMAAAKVAEAARQRVKKDGDNMLGVWYGGLRWQFSG